MNKVHVPFVDLDAPNVKPIIISAMLVSIEDERR